MFPTALKGAGLTAFPFNPALILSVGSRNLLRHKSFYRLTEQLSYALLYCTHSCCCRSTRLNIFLQADDVLHLQWADWLILQFLDPCTSPYKHITAYSGQELLTQTGKTVWLTLTKHTLHVIFRYRSAERYFDYLQYLEHLNPSEIRCERFTNFVMYFCRFMYFYKAVIILLFSFSNFTT